MNKRNLLLSLCALLAKPALALYDPKPSPALLPALGSWRGTLVYADYQKPGKFVTLQARLVVSLAGPDELSLYYVFDDGPGKTVYSYERMAFDLAKNELTWASGLTKLSTSSYKITASTAAENSSKIDFERTVDAGTDQFSFELTASSWQLTKREVRAGKPALERSKYLFTKTQN